MKIVIEQLCQMAVKLIQSHPQASPEQLAKDLQQVFKDDSELAASFRQSNYGNAKGFQTLVEGGIANIGDHFHFNQERLQAVLEIFLQKYFPQPPSQLKGNPFQPPQPREGGLFGRKDELEKLHQLLQSGKNVCVVSGMGGVGQTGLVREYANLTECTSLFTGGVYYIDARDRQNMVNGIIALTQWRFKPDLPANLSTQQMVTACWQQWKYQTEKVLLILDNVSGLADNIKTYLRPADLVFLRVLMTSRETPDKGIAEKLELEVLSEAAAVELLAAIIGQSRIDAEPEQAKLLCYELGYLPLALELVAYYLDDEDYQDLSLLAMRGKLQEKVKHPSLSPEQVPGGMQAQRGLQAAFDLSWDELKPEAQYLACVLAAFAPSPIRWDFVTRIYQQLQGESFNEDDLKDRWLKSLRNLHFVMKFEKDIYNLHLLIHDYFSQQLKQHLNFSPVKQAFCDVFAIVATNINQPINLETFNLIEPHLKKIITWYENKENLEFARSLNGLGLLYDSQGQYSKAKPFYHQSLEILECQLGSEHLEVATGLNNLAALYYYQGRYSEAEPRYLRALKIRECQLGAEHLDVATSLDNLAELYKHQKRYSEAESICLRALKIREYKLGAEHPDVAISLNNLADLYHSQGRYSKAQPLYFQSLEILQYQPKVNDLYIASIYNNLAGLYRLQENYRQAESYYLQSLEIRKCQLGTEHPDVAKSLNNLAALYYCQGQYNEAESYYIQSLEIVKPLLGTEHPNVAQIFNNLGLVYKAQKRYSEAKHLYFQSLEIRKRQLGAEHSDIAESFNNLAWLYAAENKYPKAEIFGKKALAIYQKTLGNEHPDTQNAAATVKMLYRMELLHCSKETLVGILQALAQQANLPALNTETTLTLLKMIESNPELLSSIQEYLQQQTEVSDDNT